MPFDIAFTEEDYGVNEDRSWLKAMKGMNTCRSITLDVSTFLAAHVVGGAIPSGTILAALDPGDPLTKYGPYMPAGSAGTGDDVAPTFVITRTATGGTFNVLLNGDASDDLDASAAVTAAGVQAAIRAIAPEYEDVTVAGANGGPLTITGVGFTDDLDVVVDDSAATGGTVVVAGGVVGAVGNLGTAAGILFNTTPVGTKIARAGDSVNLATAADVGVPMFWEGIVDRSKLPTFAGTNVGELDDAAEADLRFIRFED